MLAFEILVNGKRICVAGTAPVNRVLSAALSWTHHEPDQLRPHVGGIPAETDQHFNYHVPEIGLGDELLIRIVETDDIDEPDEFRPPIDNSGRL